MERTVYVGLDVHADTIAVATAEEGRNGEVRFCPFMERHRSLVLSGLQSQTDFAVRRRYSWLRNYHDIVIREFLEMVDPEALSEDHNILAKDIFRSCRSPIGLRRKGHKVPL